MDGSIQEQIPTQMKIYTRTGDGGSTGLFGGPRIPKDDGRIEAYGTIDELNAAIGMVRSSAVPVEIDRQLDTIQHELFSIGAELATPQPEKHDMRIVGGDHIERLEQWIDQHEATLPELKNFILPVGSPAATGTHLARAICRRAERRVITLANHLAANHLGSGESPVSDHIIVYLNRLSDLLFVVARVINQSAGAVEQAWQRP